MTATAVAADHPVITELARSLAQAAKAIRELEQAAATVQGVTGVELAAIQLLLDRPDGISPVEVAHSLDLHIGEGARLVDHLRASGLVQSRTVDDITLVAATPAAGAVADGVTQALAARLAELGLSDDQLVAVSAVCRRLVWP